MENVRFGTTPQLFTFRCRAHAVPAAQKQREAVFLLQRRDHSADAGGRVLQLLRRGGQAAGLNGADKRAVTVKLLNILLCLNVKDSVINHRFTQSIAR